MYKGKVELTATVFNGTITFAPTEFDAAWAPGARLRVSCPDGTNIDGTVWVSGVPSEDAVVLEAQVLFETILSRLAYSLELAIGLSRVTSNEVEPELPTSGYILNAGTRYYYLTGHAPSVFRSIDPQEVQQSINAQSPPGERNYNQFRSARLSTGAVEEFMHLYRILCELCGDSSQAVVEQFIRRVEPSVAATPSPKDPSKSETLYTRLRNELAHKRQGSDIETTKQGMLESVGALRKIVRQAIVDYA